MNDRVNPFEVLYVSEVARPDTFVRLFSPHLVQHTLPLFQPGNVVLKGTVGSGKTMLLDLLQPEIRLAFAAANLPFPIGQPLDRFVGAGVNLRHLNIADFGRLVDQSGDKRAREELPLLIVDFVNWAIVRDALRSVECFSNSGSQEVTRRLLGDCSTGALDNFAQHVARDESWFGALDKVRTYKGLVRALDQRLQHYRNFMNQNGELPEIVHRTRSSAGLPVGATARALRAAGVFRERTELFVRIDQYEELVDLERDARNSISKAVRWEVNRFLSLRSGDVHFRIGVRRYAWSEVLDFGSDRIPLEKEREYREVDIDAILRRKENISDPFPAFAEDVVERRLAVSRFQIRKQNGSILKALFGPSENPSDEARRYIRRSDDPAKACLHAGAISSAWSAFLAELARNDPFEAQLAAAWMRQHPAVKRPPSDAPSGVMPWKRPYWRKERREQGLLQIAGHQGQRIHWSGANDIRILSGGNVLVFVSLCRFTWDAWLRLRTRSEKRALGRVQPLPMIPPEAQRYGIEDASMYWFGKIPEQPQGATRQAFVLYVGELLRSKLFYDDKMSYPGRNGFSISHADLIRDPEIAQFLRDAVDAGDIVDAPHRTKEKRKEPRRKYYFQPVLSPKLQLPAIHTKEPWYVRIDTVRDWLARSADLLRHRVTAGDDAAVSHADLPSTAEAE